MFMSKEEIELACSRGTLATAHANGNEDFSVLSIVVRLQSLK